MSNLLKVAMIQMLETGINGVLRQDPHVLASLQRVAAGKSLRLACMSTSDNSADAGDSNDLALTLIIGMDRLHLHSESLEPADACIQGSRKALLNLIFSDEPAAALYHPELVLSGDVHLIHSIHKTITQADTRWDDLLAPLLKPFMGDTGTAAASHSINGGLQFMHQGAQTLRLTLRDFLQEESGLLPTRNETGMANDRLDDMRLRLDRLHARAEYLRTLVTN